MNGSAFQYFMVMNDSWSPLKVEEETYIKKKKMAITTWCNDKLNYSRGELSPVECIMLTNINYKASFIKVKV